MTRRTNRRARRDGGFSLVEVMLVSAMMMTVLTTVGIGLRSAHQSRRELDRREQLSAVAAELIDRLFRIPFGEQGARAATTSELDEFFDADADLGAVTLTGLRTPVGGAAWSVQFAEFPWGGAFELRVDGDLNGDGDEADAREGRSDLLRVNVSWNGTPILESLRCAPWSQS
jgi:hypothetical protein